MEGYMLNLENREICKECGGMCCKKSGCDYWVSDFEDKSYKYLYEKLMEGNISIVSTISFENLPNGNLYANPFLYLRARNQNRPIVDLLSMKTTCSMLGECGCKYGMDKRPGGGVNLIPTEDHRCKPFKNPLVEMRKWESYQKVLSKLVKRISGYSVDERFRMDVKNLFTDVINEKYEGVSQIELKEIASLIPYLVQAFPNEYEQATHECQKPCIYVKK